MRWIGLVCGILSLLACDDRIYGEVAGGTEVEGGLAGVRSIVEGQCLGCHGASSALGGLDLETDLIAATVGVVGQYQIPIVRPGAPEDSMLYLVTTNTQPDGTSGEMPPGSGGLDPSATDVIFDWIAGGAGSE
ncbi:MAG TPA: hypothetical protein ENK18_17230 [Deltaproteobacteria bacterium]|nr:hypothetical protein [Deltaproteobacteria bacterium]